MFEEAPQDILTGYLWLDRYHGCTQVEEYFRPVTYIRPDVEYKVAGAEELAIKRFGNTAVTDVFRL